MRLGAESLEDAGELDGDVAGTADNDLLRHFRKIERVVGDDAQFGAGNGWALGVAAGGDDDLFRGDSFASDVQCVRVDEGGAGVEDRRTGVVQEAAVDAFETGDLAVLGGDQFGPVVRAFFDGPAEAGGVVGPGAVFAGLDEEFFRDAADVDAGAAPEAFLGDAYLGAVAGGDAGATNPGRAAANDEKIKVHVGRSSCQRRGAERSARHLVPASWGLNWARNMPVARWEAFRWAVPWIPSWHEPAVRETRTNENRQRYRDSDVGTRSAGESPSHRSRNEGEKRRHADSR